MRTIIHALIAIGFAGAAPSFAADVAGDVRPFVALKISPEVRLLTTPDDYFGPVIGNIVIIEQSDGLVLVDSGANIGHGRKAVAYIRSFTRKPVKAVVITHWHNDHPSGIAALKQAWPKLRIISTPQTKTGMAGPALENIALKPDASMEKKLASQLEGFKAQAALLLQAPDTPEDRKQRIRKALVQYDEFYDDFKGSYLVLPTETFKSALRIGDRKVPVALRYFGRANTEGDAVAWLPKQRILASGDIVTAPVPFGSGSYPSPWITVLNKFKSLGFKTLIPGHGAPMNDASYIDKMIASIATIREKVDTAAKAGMSFQDIKKNIDLSGESDRFGSTPRSKMFAPVLWTDPMRINAYKEAEGLPIRQIASVAPDPK